MLVFAAERFPMGKFHIFDVVQSLDVERDHQPIVGLSAAWDFPWDTTRAREVALFRTDTPSYLAGYRIGELGPAPRPPTLSDRQPLVGTG